ncbi:unnamed protein product [Aureobasidium uvarum]|uniref:Uncharacterized protein n=1 Tax=Aureobasidium uvarum TaxID=2773716 RepID=A0A9N8PVS3_9PEZI|nr:unnamed protein product [Aureobasidium uvarum]
MKRHRKNSAKESVTHYKPVDFTIHSEDSLGNLSRFPREIRNMIYSAIVPSIMAHSFESTNIDHRVVRELINAPIMATSKQLCVEFLEIFIREIHMEASNEHYRKCHPEPGDEYDSVGSCLQEPADGRGEACPDCLEKFLAFVKGRIEYDFLSNRRRLGLQINTFYFQMDKHTQECREGNLEELPQRLQRLWDIHEDFRVPSDHIYLNMDYGQPGDYIHWRLPDNLPFNSLPHHFWSPDFEFVSTNIELSDEEASTRLFHDMRRKLKAEITAYKALKLREFLESSPNEEEYACMKKQLNHVCYTFYRGGIQPMLEFHIDMAKTALEFWKAKEEQYNVWHLFDLAESWLAEK